LKLQRSSGILNRMPIDLRIRRAVAVGAVTCLAAVQPIAAQSSPSLSVNDPDIKLLFPLAQKVQVMAELCVKELPAQSQGVPAALAAWNERHARPQLDSLIERTMKRRAAMGRGIIRMMGAQLFNGDPAGACSNFAAHISSAENDLSVSDPTALRNAVGSLTLRSFSAELICAAKLLQAPAGSPLKSCAPIILMMPRPIAARRFIVRSMSESSCGRACRSFQAASAAGTPCDCAGNSFTQSSAMTCTFCASGKSSLMSGSLTESDGELCAAIGCTAARHVTAPTATALRMRRSIGMRFSIPLERWSFKVTLGNNHVRRARDWRWATRHLVHRRPRPLRSSTASPGIAQRDQFCPSRRWLALGQENARSP
jgi:hypothetical protein